MQHETDGLLNHPAPNWSKTRTHSVKEKLRSVYLSSHFALQYSIFLFEV